MDRKEPTVKRRTLGRALEVAGDARKLAQFLGLALDELQDWIAGRAEVPMAVFLAMIDIVAANSLTPASLVSLQRMRATLGYGPAH
jgi:DNA-binding transcriptional regulator YdaS (Cro superfamily)